MKNKIKAYVDYQFRFDHSKEAEDKKAEIVANLYDRYDQLLEKYHDEEKAYIETIKQIGDFNIKEEEIPDEYGIKPSWPDIAMIVATAFAVFGLATTVFSLVYGSIMLAISISLYAASCFYLFNYSQYVKKVEMDVVKHNMLLKKIFQFMKTNFVFWSISISLIASNFIQGLFSLIGGYGFMTITSFLGSNPQEIIYAAQNLIVVGILTLIILLIVCYSYFKKLYSKLMRKYYYLTGDKSLKSHGQMAKDFLDDDSEVKKKTPLGILVNRFTIILINFITLNLACKTTVTIHNPYFNGSVVNAIGTYYLVDLGDNTIFSITFYILLISLAITNLLMIIFRKKDIIKILAIFIQPALLVVSLLAIVFARTVASSYDLGYIFVAMGLDIAFIVLFIVSEHMKKKANRESVKENI